MAIQLSTEVHIAPIPFSISYRDNILTIGSCFAANIGERMARLKFAATYNPFGVVYNPVSVCNALKLMLSKQLLTDNDLGFSNGLWYSFYHHGSFSSSSKEQALLQMNEEIEKGAALIQQLDVLAITLGTAMVYEYKPTGQVVANCHKLPASAFNHRMLSVDEVVEQLSVAIGRLQQQRPSLKTILTVSPIRHVKDGFTSNQLSKSTLLLAANAVCKNHGNVAYFPAYEIMMDELRDYRFYANDMLHPSGMAVEYIWQKFAAATLDKEALAVLPEVEKLLAAKEHRPFNPHTDEHKAFLLSYLKKTQQLKKRYPFLALESELEYFMQ